MNKEHRKHAKLARPSLGEWGRNELALLGAPCSALREFADGLVRHFAGSQRIGFADADHHAEDEGPTLRDAACRFTDKIGRYRFDLAASPSRPVMHALFRDCVLVLVNGNHFSAQRQIVFIDPAKPLHSKLDRLTDVRLVLLPDAEAAIPDYLREILAGVPVLSLDAPDSITGFFAEYLAKTTPALNGLVLAGGESRRMGRDKGEITYHRLSQREHVFGMLRHYCDDVYVSCNAAQRAEMALPSIEDRFLGIGPMGGILSAFQSDPDAAWLVVACDLPFLSAASLDRLVESRDPSALASAFRDAAGLPEPMVAIWEPRAYPELLGALGEGMTCPRKILIQSGAGLLDPPDFAELQNINDPVAGSRAMALLQAHDNDPK